MTDIYELLDDVTRTFRKGAEVTHRTVGSVGVTEVFGYPHYEGPEATGYELVDVHFVIVGVDREKAERRRPDLERWLAEYPQPERLAQGPSYIEVGGVIGDQDMAFRLFALGKVLGLWDVITPRLLVGDDEALANDLAGKGFVMMSGWKP